jgi:hypothetical protein
MLRRSINSFLNFIKVNLLELFKYAKKTILDHPTICHEHFLFCEENKFIEQER